MSTLRLATCSRSSECCPLRYSGKAKGTLRVRAARAMNTYSMQALILKYCTPAASPPRLHQMCVIIHPVQYTILERQAVRCCKNSQVQCMHACTLLARHQNTGMAEFKAYGELRLTLLVHALHGGGGCQCNCAPDHDWLLRTIGKRQLAAEAATRMRFQIMQLVTGTYTQQVSTQLPVSQGHAADSTWFDFNFPCGV